MFEARSLKEGWDYRPDWRLHVIENYLVEIAGAKDRGDALQESCGASWLPTLGKDSATG